eukprot:18487-Heterococcus_DN1.PRE.2
MELSATVQRLTVEFVPLEKCNAFFTSSVSISVSSSTAIAVAYLDMLLSAAQRNTLFNTAITFPMQLAVSMHAQHHTDLALPA